MMYYSAKTNGFYTPDIHGAQMPADAVAISAEAYGDLMQAQSLGAVISADQDGHPVATAPVALSAGELQASARAAMVCSRFQARAALHLAGLLDAAEAAVVGADRITQLAWSDAQTFRRESPTIAALAVALGLDDLAVDDLFRQAATIEA
ncbi:hypothetical protein PUH89_04045 [Rhodobacter capsulatus]|uniref:Uncharacterized protein n=1 Tax=Rhodobacter capsulatus TaxID=1061 RepID=A0A1G7PVA6_RHOCA|nr:hypothetical protein [Rhodobacter capsulatus]WER10173.1 hypothetical protein PUH89_04045 [Rhodobacter capsulatus]SDF90262.1 hypothetical protein SAMN04244550_03063 [Rhodobacter capsulatus]